MLISERIALCHKVKNLDLYTAEMYGCSNARGSQVSNEVGKTDKIKRALENVILARSRNYLNTYERIDN